MTAPRFRSPFLPVYSSGRREQFLIALERFVKGFLFLDGRPIEKPPGLFLGTAASPNDPMPQHEALRLEKKINAGSQFFQTQLIYDIELLERWLEELEKRHLLSKIYILAGIGPLRSVRVARYMLEHIPDIVVPAKVVELMEQSPDPEETGLEITLRLIEQVKQLQGVSGIHIMSIGWESILPRLLCEAGLMNHVRAW